MKHRYCAKNLVERFFFLVALVLTLGCSQSKNEPSPTTSSPEKIFSGHELEGSVIQNLGKNVILSTYLGLSKSAAELRDQVAVLEASRTQENLNKAQNLWKQCRYYWESTEAFLFGPVESLSVDPMIDTWPLNRADLDAILQSGSPIKAEVLRTLGTNLKGFHTAEYLLFGNGLRSNQKIISDLSAREIEYLKAATVVLAEDTEKLTAAWVNHSNPDDPNSKSYLSILTEPQLSNAIYSSPQAVISELVNGMVGIADEVGSGKIADPLGGSLGEANPTAEESPFSWNSVSDFSNNIRSIQMLYTGQSEMGAGAGIRDLVAAKDPLLARQIEDQIALAIQKIQQISSDGMPFGQAILNEVGRSRVLLAQQEVNNLHLLLKQKVLPLLQ